MMLVVVLLLLLITGQQKLLSVSFYLIILMARFQECVFYTSDCTSIRKIQRICTYYYKRPSLLIVSLV